MGLGDAAAAAVLRRRWAVRAPIALYRHGLGWLLGSRVLLLTHTGRRSGQPRYVCLEVVQRPDPTHLIVVSGFGTRAQWYRNLSADPVCRVSTGRRRDVPARARMLSDDEGAEVLQAYARDHPRAWHHLSAAMARLLGHPVDRFPVVEFVLG